MMNFKLLRRYRQIINILVKYGFQDVLADAGVSLKARVVEAFLPKNTISKIHEQSRWERMRLAVEELGTTYIKFAQILSNRPDIIPLELVAEFEKLQQHVPAFPGEEARKIVEEETGKSIDELFAGFEETPFASASIAQVHFATLKNGNKVALKVRRPDIMDKIELDIEIMKYLARQMEEHQILDKLDPQGIVRAFESAIHKELDLVHEGYNLQRFAQNFEGSETVFVPKYYQEYTTKKLLTMEFVEGGSPLRQRRPGPYWRRWAYSGAKWFSSAVQADI